jgi:cobalt/nickel transport system permease protein
VSTALLIQALFFGDGGVLAYGANAFNMAVVMPFVGYAIYGSATRGVSLTARRRPIAAGVGAYVGINAAALLTAVEFGLQPELFHRADGTPLYAPFHLAQSIPTMMFAHLTVAGGVEFAVTAGVIAYLQRANLPLLRINHPNIPNVANVRVSDGDGADVPAVRWRFALIGLAVMVILTPVGLLAPGSAFGEDLPPTVGVLRGYDVTGGAHPMLGYLASAAVGLGAIALVAVGAFTLARRRSRHVAYQP